MNSEKLFLTVNKTIIPFSKILKIVPEFDINERRINYNDDCINILFTLYAVFDENNKEILYSRTFPIPFNTKWELSNFFKDVFPEKSSAFVNDFMDVIINTISENDIIDFSNFSEELNTILL